MGKSEECEDVLICRFENVENVLMY